MNLRQTNQTEHDLATVPSLVFAAPSASSRIVANMGEPLVFDEEVDEDEDDIIEWRGGDTTEIEA